MRETADPRHVFAEVAVEIILLPLHSALWYIRIGVLAVWLCVPLLLFGTFLEHAVETDSFRFLWNTADAVVAVGQWIVDAATRLYEKSADLVWIGVMMLGGLGHYVLVDVLRRLPLTPMPRYQRQWVVLFFALSVAVLLESPSEPLYGHKGEFTLFIYHFLWITGAVAYALLALGERFVDATERLVQRWMWKLCGVPTSPAPNASHAVPSAVDTDRVGVAPLGTATDSYSLSERRAPASPRPAVEVFALCIALGLFVHALITVLPQGHTTMDGARMVEMCDQTMPGQSRESPLRNFVCGTLVDSTAGNPEEAGYGSPAEFCLPDDLDPRQGPSTRQSSEKLRAVVIDFVGSFAEMRYRPALDVVREAFAHTWPCK